MQIKHGQGILFRKKDAGYLAVHMPVTDKASA